MTLKGMKSKLRDFERKVFLGSTALAGAGATAAVATWQSDLAELAKTRDTFIAATGEDAVVVGTYDKIASTLDALATTVSSGSKEAVHHAAMNFYTTLIQGHDIFARYVPQEVRGEEKESEQVLMQVGSILSSALGIN